LEGTLGSIVFIDTNIWLDFYRVRTRERALAILEHINPATHERFISSAQVEMEFKKNRQAVILASYALVKPPTFEGLKELPAFLADSKQSSGLQTSEKRLKQLTATLKQRITRVLREPTKHDHVYRVAQRLFKSDSPHNLRRDRKVRFEIRRLARKRFVLGYPPRKDEDTSIGDAVNWEWIIRCAKDSGEDVVIVSRDADYGVQLGGEMVANDWLAQEFRERVSRKRKLVLTDRLAEGLRAAGIKVTKGEEDEEREFLTEGRSIRREGVGGFGPRSVQLPLTNLADGGLPLGAMWSDTISGLQRQVADPKFLQAMEASRSSFERVRERLEAAELSGQLRRIHETLQSMPTAQQLKALNERLKRPMTKEEGVGTKETPADEEFET
jgi:hypothetical protein